MEKLETKDIEVVELKDEDLKTVSAGFKDNILMSNKIESGAPAKPEIKIIIETQTTRIDNLDE